MELNRRTQDQWFESVRSIVQDIRGWDDWRTGPLARMRAETGQAHLGTVALHAYSRYVRRFTLIMCSVLSKAPEADERFWSLALNLYDELGGSRGLPAAHGRLLVDFSSMSANNTSAETQARLERVDSLERDLFTELTTLRWPLSLFALGPGTESVSDLFLEPIEHWCVRSLVDRPLAQEYFDMHRSAVEHEHQLEISRVISEELSAIDSLSASDDLLEQGKGGRCEDCKEARRGDLALLPLRIDSRHSDSSLPAFLTPQGPESKASKRSACAQSTAPVNRSVRASPTTLDRDDSRNRCHGLPAQDLTFRQHLEDHSERLRASAGREAHEIRHRLLKAIAEEAANAYEALTRHATSPLGKRDPPLLARRDPDAERDLDQVRSARCSSVCEST